MEALALLKKGGSEHIVRLYGPEHLIYLAVLIVVFAAVITLTVLFAKTDKQKSIVVKSVAVALLVMIIANRITLAVWDNNGIGWLELIPNTYCGMTSLLLPIFVLVGKPHNRAFDFFFYLEVFGGIVTTFYSNFLDQGPSFMFAPTITGMIHHGIGLLLCIMLVICKWFEPSLKGWKTFPIGISAYTLFGLFLLDVLKIPYTMHIDTPILPNTPLKWWFFLLVGSAGLFVLLFGYELIKKRVLAQKAENKDAAATEQASDTPENM